MRKQFSLNREIRSAFATELETLELEQLNFIPPTHHNNIFWNIAHCIAVQQSLCYSLSGLNTPVDIALVKGYRRGTTPEGPVSQAFVDETRALLDSSLDQLEKDWTEGIFKTYTPYTVGFGTHLANINQAIEFNNIHEAVHYGYILALKKLL